MKKLFCYTILSIMFLFIVWTIIAWTQYDTDIIYLHLDLKTMIKNATYSINLGSSKIFEGKNLWTVLKEIEQGYNKILSYSLVGKALNQVGQNFESIPIGFKIILSAINALLDPINSLLSSAYLFIYIILIPLEIIMYFVSFIMGIINFIFSPVFINPYA